MKKYLTENKAILVISIFAIIGLTGLSKSLKNLKVYKVPTGSMEPTIRQNSYILVDTNHYNKQRPKRYDIILFKSTHTNEKPFVKRVLGLPGELIEMRNNAAFINGHKVHPPTGLHYYESPIATPAVYLQKNEYYVVGDNSKNSHDSRFFGAVSLEQINGKIVKIYTP